MQYLKESSVICLGNTKQAALYFDRIFPVSFFLKEVMCHPAMKNYWEGLNKIDKKSYEIYKEKSKPELKKMLAKLTKDSKVNVVSIVDNLLGKDKPNYIVEFFLLVFQVLFKHMGLIMFAGVLYRNQDRLSEFPKAAVKRFNSVFKIEELNINNVYHFFNNSNDLLSIFYAEDIQIEKLSRTIRSDIDVISKKWAKISGQVLIPSFCLTASAATENDITLTIGNIDLVDTSKASWEQIIELRDDQEARRRLRNLRLFLHENYKGRSRAFIEDDLCKRLDEYKATCKDWGFETKTSTISAVLDSKNLRMTMAAAAGAVVFGKPIVAGASVLAGAAIEIGNIVLTIAKQKHAFQKLKRNHHLAYIIEAKERFENKSKP
jgi:hypothetical protein